MSTNAGSSKQARPQERRSAPGRRSPRGPARHRRAASREPAIHREGFSGADHRPAASGAAARAPPAGRGWPRKQGRTSSCGGEASWRPPLGGRGEARAAAAPTSGQERIGRAAPRSRRTAASTAAAAAGSRASGHLREAEDEQASGPGGLNGRRCRGRRRSGGRRAVPRLSASSRGHEAPPATRAQRPRLTANTEGPARTPARAHAAQHPAGPAPARPAAARAVHPGRLLPLLAVREGSAVISAQRSRRLQRGAPAPLGPGPCGDQRRAPPRAPARTPSDAAAEQARARCERTRRRPREVRRAARPRSSSPPKVSV